MEYLQEALTQGIAPAIIVGIYLLLTKIIDNKKESSQAKVNAQVMDCLNNLNSFLNHITKDIIENDKSKCQMMIHDSFKAFANSIIKFSTDVVINNNLEINKLVILDNLEHLVNSEYYDIHSKLCLFNSSSLQITSFMKVDWKEEIKSDVIEVVFHEQMSKEQKIYTINNKINIKVNNYIVYLTNIYHSNGK